MAATETDDVLRATGVSKTFGGVTALDDVDFALRDREVHGLVGQNGAGKSTLVKIINGVHEPDKGSLEVAGKAVTLSSPMQARDVGIAMVFQEFSLIPTLNVAQNVFLNSEPRRGGGLIDDAAASRQTRETWSASVSTSILLPTSADCPSAPSSSSRSPRPCRAHPRFSSSTSPPPPSPRPRW